MTHYDSEQPWLKIRHCPISPDIMESGGSINGSWRNRLANLPLRGAAQSKSGNDVVKHHHHAEGRMTHYDSEQPWLKIDGFECRQ
jgi:hypothetical protein